MARPPSAPRLTPRAPGSTALVREPADPALPADRDGVEILDPETLEAEEGVAEHDTLALDLRGPGGTSEFGSSRRRRVLEPDDGAPRAVDFGELLRAVRAGLESVVLSWLLVTVPVVAAYVATVASPVLGEASWFDAARSASAGWLLGLGQEMTVTGADGAATTVTLAPIALTLLTAALLANRVRRARLVSPTAFAVAGVVALAAVGAVHGLAGSTPSPRAVVTTLVVVAAAVLAGAARSGALPALLDTPGAAAVVAGLRAGWRAATWLLVLGALTVGVVLVAGAAAVLGLHGALGADPLSTGVLLLAQVVALPTFAVWAGSWWLGPGFSIGIVDVSSTGVGEGPLPVLPVLAALPQAGPGPGSWVVVVPVLVLTALALASLRRSGTGWRDQVVTLATTVVTLTLLAVIAAGLSGGVDGAAIGPLTDVGTRALPVALAVAWVSALASALAWVLLWGARRLDLAGRFPVLTEVAAAGRRLRGAVAGLPRLRRRRRSERRLSHSEGPSRSKGPSRWRGFSRRA